MTREENKKLCLVETEVTAEVINMASLGYSQEEIENYVNRRNCEFTLKKGELVVISKLRRFYKNLAYAAKRTRMTAIAKRNISIERKKYFSIQRIAERFNEYRDRFCDIQRGKLEVQEMERIAKLFGRSISRRLKGIQSAIFGRGFADILDSLRYSASNRISDIAVIK